MSSISSDRDDIDDLLGDSDEELEAVAASTDAEPVPGVSPVLLPPSRKSSKRIQCPLCRENFGKAGSDYLAHKEKDHPFFCKFCDLRFTFKHGLEDHQNKEHEFELKNEKSLKRCETCGQGFNKERSYTRHLTQEHKYPCHACEYVFINSHELEAHIDSSHRDMIKKAKSKEKTKSNGASKPRKIKPKKKDAKKSNELVDETLFEDDAACEKCRQEFLDTEEFQIHIELPHNYECQVKECELSFVHVYYLHLHEHEHHKIRAAPDPSSKPPESIRKDVGEVSKEDISLLSLDESLFNSSLTNKSTQVFKRRSSRDRSQLQFNCTVPHCPQSFESMSHLKIHLDSDHLSPSKKQFFCKHCGEEFTQQADLTSHEELDHSHACYLGNCFKTFTERSELETHLADDHSVAYARISGDHRERGTVRTVKTKTDDDVPDIVEWAEEWIR